MAVVMCGDEQSVPLFQMRNTIELFFTRLYWHREDWTGHHE